MQMNVAFSELTYCATPARFHGLIPGETKTLRTCWQSGSIRKSILQLGARLWAPSHTLVAIVFVVHNLITKMIDELVK